jgi:hypothetical protein
MSVMVLPMPGAGAADGSDDVGVGAAAATDSAELASAEGTRGTELVGAAQATAHTPEAAT